MSYVTRRDIDEYAQRLYARLPTHYQAHDAEQGMPLYALLRIVGVQAAQLRKDLDELWDNFFVETCADWVVPYLGALVGTNILAQPVGQSDRLEVWNTVLWRRSKGTPAMLRKLATVISGWPVDLTEFFQHLGWSQQVNHVRPNHPLTPDLRDPYMLSLLGHVADRTAHAADFRVPHSLDASRVGADAPGIGRAAWGTPGRYQIKHIGLFVRRLQTFALKGVTPAAAEPGAPSDPTVTCFTFDPLFRSAPLFATTSATPITRAAFNHAPWETFGTDVSVRQFGVLLASEAAPHDAATSNTNPAAEVPFTFGDAGSGLALHLKAGMRLMDRRSFQLGAAHFVINAVWHESVGDVPRMLGTLSTLLAARRETATLDGNEAYRRVHTAAGRGRLAITVQCGCPTVEWPALPPSPPARFPGGVLAVRAANDDSWHDADALYISLPACFIQPGPGITFWVAADGSTYAEPAFNQSTLAQASKGQVYPARNVSFNLEPETGYSMIRRTAGAVRIVDTARFGAVPPGALFEVGVFTEDRFQRLGAVATVSQPRNPTYTKLDVPDPWPAYTYGCDLLTPETSDGSLAALSIRVTPLDGATTIPPTELIITSRDGRALLVYLPEVIFNTTSDVLLFVATDGSTYLAPVHEALRKDVVKRLSYDGLTCARAAFGQNLPIPGVWPLQQRHPIGLNMYRRAPAVQLWPGELGIDPEFGGFVFAVGDPAVPYARAQPDPAIPGELATQNPLTPQHGLTVDYVEGFSDRVGARACDQSFGSQAAPTRLVARLGDAYTDRNPDLPRDHIHVSVADALAHAKDNEVIEIVDSATYAETTYIPVPASVKSLVLRAATGQRPCLTFYTGKGEPTAASLHIAADVDRMALIGLLISGGALTLAGSVTDLSLTGCTLDPRAAGTAGSLVATDSDTIHEASYLLSRCITGGLYMAGGIRHLTVADSIVDAGGTLAIGGSPPASGVSLSNQSAAQLLHLERVTVFGQVRCDMLNANECLLDDLILVDDQQTGCIRFSRYEPGSILPRRYQCIPTEAQLRTSTRCERHIRCVGPVFHSRRFGRPDYGQLATSCPPAIVTGSEQGAEIGAFAGTLNTIRLQNLHIKLHEFLPVGLSAVVVADT